jgi:PleD family two-component response regulator
VTLSAGVAAAEGDVDDFLLAADSALYRAKSSGRNRVLVAGRPVAARELAIHP